MGRCWTTRCQQRPAVPAVRRVASVSYSRARLSNRYRRHFGRTACRRPVARGAEQDLGVPNVDETRLDEEERVFQAAVEIHERKYKVRNVVWCRCDSFWGCDVARAGAVGIWNTLILSFKYQYARSNTWTNRILQAEARFFCLWGLLPKRNYST
jgi:hypothetical protein